MRHAAIAGMALLMLSGAAIAQPGPPEPSPPPVVEGGPGAGGGPGVTPPAPGERMLPPQRHRGGEEMLRHRRMMEKMLRQHRRGHGPQAGQLERRGRPGMQGHHPHGAAGAGAIFRFELGDDGPTITIRCAAGDSTQACADAVMPLLQALVPSPSAP